MQGPSQLVDYSTRESGLTIHITGDWNTAGGIPDFPAARLDGVASARFEAGRLEGWSSCLPVFVLKVAETCRAANLPLDDSGLPEGLRRLTALVRAVPERTGAARAGHARGWLARIGQTTLDVAGSCAGILSFTGELASAFGRMARGRARFRRVDFLEALHESGAQALGIVSLISVLVGTILAFLGSVQLRMFGAEIFVANLVGIGMVREMGALMTAVIMTGRTGAAFAARLGTMQVNEEVDALRTLAFDPVEFLVLPRVMAMALMMPLLTIYANFLGILGGALVGVFMLDITPVQYFIQTRAGVTPAGIASGLVKSFVFGVLVAICACMNGIRCGRSAMAVGVATTRAVVSGIVAIIVADSLLNIIYIIIGF